MGVVQISVFNRSLIFSRLLPSLLTRSMFSRHVQISCFRVFHDFIHTFSQRVQLAREFNFGMGTPISDSGDD